MQFNSEQLQPIYDWFKSSLRLAVTGRWNRNSSVSLCDRDEKAQVLEFLHAADLNIEDIIVEKKPYDADVLTEHFSERTKQEVAGNLKGMQRTDIKMVHKCTEGGDVIFDFKDESDGTRKLFAIDGYWIDSLKYGCILFIDGLHDNLHPKLVQFLVQLFHSNDTNPKNAQLVFTTHETSILNREVFRRDQIWFCEKGNDRATTLYPLTDFSPRKGRENLELTYLSGRYGALPYIRTLRKQG